MSSSLLRRCRLPLLVLAALAFARVPPAAAQAAQERLWDAAMSGDTVAIARALTDGAKVDSLDLRRNPNGRRALNWAAWYDRVPAIRLLVARGATIDAANHTGFTPLHHAAENGSAAAATALLEAGADPAMPNGQGLLPADVARERAHFEIALELTAAAGRKK